MERVLIAVAPDGDVHVFGRVLRGAGAETVGSQRKIVIAALVVVVFAACIQFAENKLPVEAFFSGVPIQRAAAAVVFHLDGTVGESGKRDEITVSLAGFVDGIGQNFEGGVRAAIQTVRAEDDCRAQTNALFILQLTNAVVAIIGRGVCHVRSFDDSVLYAAYAPCGQCRPPWLLHAAKRRIAIGKVKPASAGNDVQ